MNPLKCAFGLHAGDFLGFMVHKRGIEINQNKTSDFRSQKPVDKEATLIFVGKNKLPKTVHIESKWQDEGIFVTAQN